MSSIRLVTLAFYPGAGRSCGRPSRSRVGRCRPTDGAGQVGFPGTHHVLSPRGTGQPQPSQVPSRERVMRRALTGIAATIALHSRHRPGSRALSWRWDSPERASGSTGRGSRRGRRPSPALRPLGRGRPTRAARYARRALRLGSSTAERTWPRAILKHPARPALP